MKTKRKALLRLAAMLCVLCMAGTACADVLVIPAVVQVIEPEAFAGIDAGTLVIPESTESIESRAFASCEQLTDVYLPESPIEIAPDAFDEPSGLTFHVYMGSENANWALDRGYHVAYMTADDLDYGGWSRVESLVQTEAVSTGNNELYYTHRLIVRLMPGFTMPDVSCFKEAEESDPVIIPLEQDYYVIQFSNPTSARNCAGALNAWSEGCCYAEADYFISESMPPSPNAAAGTAAAGDPMGFQAYAGYLGSRIPQDASVTVAVIDTGVNSSEVGCTVSAKSYDLVNGRPAKDGFENSHGTNVANVICNAFGSLADHLTLISYRVVRPSDARASYLLVGKAIRRARDDGADFVNISHVFESAYIREQDNMFLQECISYFGAGRVFASAGNNAAMSAQSALPARYCQSVTGTQYGDDGVTLVRAPGTATGADYAGYDTTTSYAAAKVTAAAALIALDPDPEHTLDAACVFVTSDCGRGMPELAKYGVTPVTQIILNNNEPIESILEIGDRASIDYEVIPDNATVSTVTVTSSDSSIVEVLSNTGVRVRILAKEKGTAILTFAADDGNVAPILVPITVVKPVASVTITGSTGETLMKGETLPLAAVVLPEDATDTSVTWSSSNDGIAVVSPTGVVSQVGAGTVTITAASNYDPAISDSVVLEVSDIPDVTGVTVTAPKAAIGIGLSAETVQMTAVVSPADADQTVVWSVDHPEIAAISETGLLTAVSDGEVIVTATSAGSGKSGYMGITVIQLPTDITITGPDTVEVDGTIQLTADVQPANARNLSVTWSSMNPAYAQIDEATGVVTGKAKGQAIIKAKAAADPSVEGLYIVNVKVLPESVVINPPASTVMDTGGTLTLTAVVSPDDASDKTVSWSSNDSAIAQVSSSGVVTAMAPGSATITASTVNGKTDRVTLTVRQPYTLSFNANGGSCGTSSWTCYSGYAIGGTLPSASRTGYTFAGWYTAASGGSQVTTATSFTSSSTVTVYAHWTANLYTVTFNKNGGASVSPETRTVTYDSTYGTLASASRTGYTLAGWYTAASGGTQITAGTKVAITAPQTLYAHWTANTYTVSYNANGGSVSPASKTVTYDSTYGTLATPTRTGYDFAGWYTAASGGTQITASTKVTITAAQTIYARWTAKNYTYSIVYKSSNGTSLGTSSETKAFGTTNTITPPAYAGYTTPAAQSVAWDATSKTITFTYAPATVATSVTTLSSNHYCSSPDEWITAVVEWQNRTATSIQIRIKWSEKIEASGYDGFAHKFYGTCGSTSIPSTTVVKLNAWANSGSVRNASATSSWITIPVTATQTSLSFSMSYKKYKSDGSATGSSYSGTWTVTIPTY